MTSFGDYPTNKQPSFALNIDTTPLSSGGSYYQIFQYSQFTPHGSPTPGQIQVPLPPVSALVVSNQGGDILFLTITTTKDTFNMIARPWSRLMINVNDPLASLTIVDNFIDLVAASTVGGDPPFTNPISSNRYITAFIEVLASNTIVHVDDYPILTNGPRQIDLIGATLTQNQQISFPGPNRSLEYYTCPGTSIMLEVVQDGPVATGPTLVEILGDGNLLIQPVLASASLPPNGSLYMTVPIAPDLFTVRFTSPAPAGTYPFDAAVFVR